MLDVYITNDVEIWCDGWNDLDKKFPQAFKQYIYGTTPAGNYGLPFQLEILQQHDIHAVFFVEPLFALRFGEDYLAEIIGMIKDKGQEIQLHLHPEWTNELPLPVIPNSQEKRQHLYMYTLEEQTELIRVAKALLENNGSNPITAFRAGSFGANNETLQALQANNIHIDSSYNQTLPCCRLVQDEPLHHRHPMDNIIEFPLSVYQDYPGHMRHVQITACSIREIKKMLLQAVDNNWDSFVILLHSFELLDNNKTNTDRFTVKRFVELCRFLDEHRDIFQCKGFEGQILSKPNTSAKPLSSDILSTTLRTIEQALRKSR